MSFEPKILGLLCNWCSYTAADLAGTSRIKYSPCFHIVRVMCSGSVDSVYILRALLEGADGVMIAGCKPGDCHYMSGNYKARRRATILKTVLKTLGLDEDRVWVRWISASEGAKLAETVNQFVEEIKKKPANSLSNSPEA
ncbi:hydrogenase iron-sulfur subunit [candidate division TA06 bacterium]|uniref:Hydrogenase iron-sulfur subunit n=1 Tax=candidate division TA06 bacterium TaxID=2250710 RepID=A0A523UP88_UNCT6|nr:MAG: hydrogenase iron-sulfur subunit [candidate division TA06 bacterium]